MADKKHLKVSETKAMEHRKQETPAGKEEIEQVVMQSQFRIAPIPDPEELRRYEEILEGAANRILLMAEEEGRERRAREKEIVDADNFISKGGLFLGFICFLIPLGLSAFLAVKGQPDFAKWLLGASVLSVIPSFLKVIRKSK